MLRRRDEHPVAALREAIRTGDGWVPVDVWLRAADSSRAASAGRAASIPSTLVADFVRRR